MDPNVNVKRGLRVLRSFLGTIELATADVEVSLGIDPEKGRADSGDLETDVKDLLLALGEAARDAEQPIALLIDELQYLPKRDLAALIRSLHAVAQEGLPLVLFGAGLPQLFAQVGEAKSYAERLFRFCEIDRLSHPDSDEVVGVRCRSRRAHRQNHESTRPSARYSHSEGDDLQPGPRGYRIHGSALRSVHEANYAAGSQGQATAALN